MLAEVKKQPQYVIDDIDKKIIQATQKGLPLTRQPYHKVAQEIGVNVKDVICRMKAMTEEGVIRRSGIVPNHYKLGFGSNGMSVWNVPESKIMKLGKQVGALDFVSHCYHRPRFLPEWPYNLFAMVHGRSREEVFEKVKYIADLLAQDDICHQVLFSRRILKKTGLRI